MLLLEPDPLNNIPPQLEAMRWFWREAVITAVPESNDAAGPFLDRLRKQFTGAEFAAFHIASHPVFEFYGSRNTLDRPYFFEDLLKRPEVLPHLESAKARKPRTTRFQYSPVNPFLWDGLMASLLFEGGAYRRRGCTASEAKRLGTEFAATLFGDRYDEITIYSFPRSLPDGTPWSSWFYDAAWDYAFVGVDKRLSHVWFLCITDTD